MISVIIPIYNEEKVLRVNSKGFAGLSDRSELIFVDGGSADNSRDLAGNYGRVFDSPKGRAKQMNLGAKQSGNDILFFLHADNLIRPQTLSTIENKMLGSGAVGGCLTQRIDNDRLVFRFIEAQGNIRARRSKVFYGDQGIFVRKDIFFQLSGFPEVPIFEDVFFSRKLRNAGKTVVLSDKIFVSARRWEKRGVIGTTVMFNLLLTMFKLDIPMERIKAFYEDLR